MEVGGAGTAAPTVATTNALAAPTAAAVGVTDEQMFARWKGGAR